MKRFLNRLLHLTTIYLTLFILVGLSSYKIKKQLINNALTLQKSKNIVILGDSHAQSGLNPNIIKNSVNLSISSEPFILTYYKLEKVIALNKNINKAIISYGFHSLSESWDVNKQYKRLKRHAKNLFEILPYNEIKKLKILLGINTYTKHLFSNFLGYPSDHTLSRLLNYISQKKLKPTDLASVYGFYKSKRSVLTKKNISDRINEYFYQKNKLYNFSDFQKLYLHKIANLCNEHQIKLILINTPIRKEYYSLIPQNYLEEYYEFYDTLVKLNSDICLFDFWDLDIPPKYYGDADHVNYLGSKMLSEEVNKKLKEVMN